MRRHYIIPLLIPLLIALAPGCDGGDDDGGFDWMAGQCGMEGMQVECVVSADCMRFGGLYNFCTNDGRCVHDMPGIYSCFNIGDACRYDDKVCGTNRMCTYPCTSHADCPYTQFCMCRGDGVFCEWIRCGGGDCPVGFHPDEGTLLCAPDSRPGDCFGPNNTCPEGFTKVADIVPGSGGAACVADATSL